MRVPFVISSLCTRTKLNLRRYKDYNTPSKLNFLTDHALQTAGIEDAADRKLILAAFRKAGYKPQSQRKAPKRKQSDVAEGEAAPESPKAKTEAGPSSLSTSAPTTPTKAPAKRRKRTLEKNEFLPTPDAAFNEVTNPASIDFNEVTDESILEPKHTVVNRAPVMAAWATIVAERLGFKRSEALSIGVSSPRGYIRVTYDADDIFQSFCIYRYERDIQGGVDRKV